MSPMAGEVEAVADEPGEPLGLGPDHAQRGLLRLLVVCDALAQCLDVAADRGQRRAALVRDDPEEVALSALGLGELAGHLGEALGQLPDLVLEASLGKLRVVAA